VSSGAISGYDYEDQADGELGDQVDGVLGQADGDVGVDGLEQAGGDLGVDGLEQGSGGQASRDPDSRRLHQVGGDLGVDGLEQGSGGQASRERRPEQSPIKGVFPGSAPGGTDDSRDPVPGEADWDRLKEIDAVAFNGHAERAFIDMLRRDLTKMSGRGILVGDVHAEGAYRLNVSTETVKRYLLKHSCRFGPFCVKDGRVFMRGDDDR